MAPSLDIVIVNWNAGQQLRDCLESIVSAKRDGFLLGRVVVVDNASTDGSLEGLDVLPLPLKIIRNAENRGFGAACNQGAALVNSEYLLFLNPDTRLFKDSLSAPVAFMEDMANQRVGIVGIQLLDDKNNIARTCARFPSLRVFVAHATGLSCFPRWRYLSMRMSDWDHGHVAEVDQVIGAFFLVRRQLYDSMGGFDQRFFIYFEEVDFSFRARQAGWRSVYLAEVQAFHAGGGTSRQVKAHRLFYSLRSRLFYGFKHFRPWQAWALLGVTLVLELVSRSIFSLFRGGGKDLYNTLKGYGMLYLDLPNIIVASRAGSRKRNDYQEKHD